MLLNRVLSLATLLAWIGLGLLLLNYGVRATRREGPEMALRRLFSQRLLLAVLLLAIGITLLNESFVFIEPQEVGVVISLVEKEGYRGGVLRSGVHWLIPLMEQVYRYPIYWQTYTMSSKPWEGERVGDDSIVARTSDGQEVSIDCTVIFQLDPEQAVRLHIEWQGRYVEDYIRPILRGVIRTQVAQYTVDEVNSDKRDSLERDLNELLRAALEDKGLLVDRFLLRNIAFSPEYAAAVELKQVALQNIIERQHQADQLRRTAQGEADAILTRAAAEAQAIQMRAQGEAEALRMLAAALAGNPEMITYRYVEKLAPGIQVMLVPNDVPYLLPLPTLSPPVTETVAPTLPLTVTLPVTPTVLPEP